MKHTFLTHFHAVNGNSNKMVQVMIEIVITCPNLVFILIKIVVK